MLLSLIYGIMPYLINFETSNDIVRRCRAFINNNRLEGLLTTYSFSFFLQRYIITIVIVLVFIKVNSIPTSSLSTLIFALSIVNTSIIVDISRIFLLRSQLMRGLVLNMLMFTLPLLLITLTSFLWRENFNINYYLYYLFFASVLVCLTIMNLFDILHGLGRQQYFDIKRFNRVRGSFIANLIDTFMPVIERSVMLYFGGANLIATVAILNIGVLSTKVIITSLLVNPNVGRELSGASTEMSFLKKSVFLTAIFVGVVTAWFLKILGFHQVDGSLILVSVVLVAFGAMSSLPHYKLIGDGAYTKLVIVSMVSAVLLMITIVFFGNYLSSNLILCAFMYGFLLFVFKHSISKI